MAFTATLTGTGRNSLITSGSNTFFVADATGLVVGANIQGVGVPAGARIGTLNGTTGTMVNASGAPVNATVTNAAASLVFSSVYGSVLTISLTASGDYATVQNIFDAGFGVMNDSGSKRSILFPGGLTVTWANIIAGAVFDFKNWVMEFGTRGCWQFEESSIFGELRGGYLVNGTQFIKTAGPTFISNDFKNSAPGGANMFSGTITGTMTGLFRMNRMTVIQQTGNNRAPFFSSGRMNCIVDNLLMDHQETAANASFGAAFGTVRNLSIVKANSGILSPNGANLATIEGLSYVGFYTESPQHKFAIPNNATLEGYAPQVLSNQLLAGFADNTTETYANIDLSSAGWGLTDLKTRYQRYGGTNIIRFPRRVTFTFKDEVGASLAGVTLLIRSGSTVLVNAVQAGDYNTNVQALEMQWTSYIASYRAPNSIVDTISQTARVRRYGRIEQSDTYSLDFVARLRSFFLPPRPALVGISEAAAAAVTTAGINWATQTITPTASLNCDEINSRIDFELCQPANSLREDPRTFDGTTMTLASGWAIDVGAGVTLSEGTNIKKLVCPTITLSGTGKVTALYATAVGASARLKIANLV